MLKSTIVALFVSVGTLTAATQAQELIDQIAPEAAQVVSDANLRTLYTEAYRLHMLEDVPFEEALRTSAQGLEIPAIRYTVDGLTVRAETDWSCRILVIEDVWVRISDC